MKLVETAKVNTRLATEIALGALAFARTGRTPPTAYLSLIEWYCRSRGRSNDLLHEIVRLAVGTYSRSNAARGFKAPPADVAQLRSDGFCYLKPLTREMCDALEEIAYRLPATLLRGQGNRLNDRSRYDPVKPEADIYSFLERDLVNEPTVQDLMADTSLLAVAHDYLGCRPVLSAVAMWWSVRSSEANAEAAQMFHFDMDRIKWLKMFFYVTAVGHDNGPHVFVVGTHRRGTQPAALLRKGYTRLSDAEIEQFYSRDLVKVFTGDRGTAFAEDTRGFHKGLHVQRGHRLLLELEFCDSLFGSDYAPSPIDNASPKLAQAMRQYRRTYMKYAATRV